MHQNLKYWVWLTIAYGPASALKWNSFSHYRSVEHMYDSILSGDLRYINPNKIKSVQSASLNMAESLIEYCLKNGINIYCYEDEDYPNSLREIYNPPSILFVKGNIKGINDTVVIAAVGTRHPSEYSSNVSARIVKDLSEAGVIITSGFAEGLDTLALKTCASSGGRAIACLPCGINYDYPKDGRNDKSLICKNGAIISEFFPDDRPSALSFRARNRIISGISLGTVILQAGSESGALSTASLAVSQGKDIFCIPPHELFNNEYAGVVPLLRDGAIPVFDSKDILNEYYSVYAHKLNFNSNALKRKAEQGLFADSKSVAEKRTFDSGKKSAQKRNKANSGADITLSQNKFICLTEDKRTILSYLSEKGIALFDDLAQKFPVISDLDILLSEMELDGYIYSLSGNRYKISQ